MESRAQVRFLRISPRKVRFVADLIRGKNVLEAYQILDFVKRRAALPIKKTIESAVANMLNDEDAGQIDIENLRIKLIYIDGGPMLKRFRPASMGRAVQVRKRTSHITVIVEDDVE